MLLCSVNDLHKNNKSILYFYYLPHTHFFFFFFVESGCWMMLFNTLSALVDVTVCTDTCPTQVLAPPSVNFPIPSMWKGRSNRAGCKICVFNLIFLQEAVSRVLKSGELKNKNKVVNLFGEAYQIDFRVGSIDSTHNSKINQSINEQWNTLFYIPGFNRSLQRYPQKCICGCIMQPVQQTLRLTTVLPGSQAARRPLVASASPHSVLDQQWRNQRTFPWPLSEIQYSLFIQSGCR